VGKRERGVLSHWNDGRGFGFIQPVGGAPEDALFVHVRAFPDRRALPVGMDLTFERGTDPRGRPCALAVRPRESLRRLLWRSFFQLQAQAAALAFMALLGLGFWASVVPAFLVLSYLVFSHLTYGVYLWDKAGAIRGAWRADPRLLYALAFLGGWPGALIAQDRLRHLTKNDRFRRFFWLATTFNVLTACWFLTPDGRFWSEAIPLVLQRLFGA
jgi:uncharacterized membrane protein YsdA (DUF1294 family)/cold shock CspA family protein